MNGMSFLGSLASSLQSGLLTVVSFLFVLSIVVVVHELGHFLVARWCGVKVDAFAMGFGRELYGWNDSKGTRWRLNWIPLGGYVKFMDDSNGASIPDAEAIARMSPEERAVSFHAKPVWQRAAIIFAGPFANFLLAVGILAGLYMVAGVTTAPARIEAVIADGPAAKAGLRQGDLITRIDQTPITTFGELQQYVGLNGDRPLSIGFLRDGKYDVVKVTPEYRDESDGLGGNVKIGNLGLTFPPIVKFVDKSMPAAAAGLEAGDTITKLDGKPISNFVEMVQIVQGSAGRTLDLTYLRDGVQHDVQITPRVDVVPDNKGGKKTIGKIGIGGMTTPSGGVWRRLGPVEAVGKGVSESVFFVTENFRAIGKMLSSGENANQAGGPLRIAAYAGKAASIGFDALLGFAVQISLSIGLMNLLPIPPLDGGHLMFYAAEAVRGRSLNDNIKDLGFKLGLSLILALFVFVMWNDRVVLKYFMGG